MNDKTKKIIFILVLLAFVLLSLYNSVNAQTMLLHRPQDNPIKAELNATVIDYAWIGSRPFKDGDSVWFYNLPKNTRIFVNYEADGYYFIEWHFNDYNDPMYGWTDKTHIILDIQVTPAPAP